MRILVIEDEIVSRLKLEKILSTYGVCHGAANGREALDAFEFAHAEQAPYHLITVDIRLPDMDGVEIVEKIRQWEAEHESARLGLEAKILMVTALEGKNVMNSFRKGCEGYLVKPFDASIVKEELLKLGILP